MVNNKVLVTFSVLVFALFCSGGFIIYLLTSINDLNSSIREKDTLINKGLKSNKQKVEKLTDSLKSFTEDWDFIVAGKKLTSRQFLELYEKLENEKLELEAKYTLAKRVYGFEIEKKISNNREMYFPKRFTEADSAALTYSVFKDRLQFIDGSWKADASGGKETKKAIKELTKMLDSLKSKQ